MTTRLRSRFLFWIAPVKVTRTGHVRHVAVTALLAIFVGGASLGFALQEADAPAGLQGVWPEFPPESLSAESLARLDGNWASWSEDAAEDVADLYAVADKDVAAQRQALARVKSRVRVLDRALRDPAYSMIRNELTNVLVPLRLRANLFEKGLDVLEADAAPAAGSARMTAAVELRNALSALESDLRAIPNGDAWLPYVRAQEVRGSIDTPAAADVMARLPEKLDPSVEGRTDAQRRFLNRPSLRRYRTAVEDYLAITRVAESGADTELLRERLAALYEAIDLHEDSPTGQTAQSIRDARTALRRAAGPVVGPIDDLIRRNYLNYNLRLVADASFLSKMVATSDINCGPVSDYFQGARVTGTQTTHTNVNLVLVPSEDVARFNLTVAGLSNSQTTAVTNQATVRSVGQHQFHAVKPITFDGDLFQLGPASLSVNPNIRHVAIATKYDNIFFGLFRGMIQRRAFREANSRIPQSRARAAMKLEQNVAPEFNSEVDQQFGEMNSNLAAFENRMERLGVAPRAERTRTTSDRFLLDAAVRAGDEVSGSPPNIGSTRGVGFTLQIHESLMNNAADRWGFAGRRMTDVEIRQELQRWFSDLLGREVTFKDDQAEQKEPTTFIFTETDPIRFRVVDGAIVLILRAGLVQENGEEIPPQIVEVPLDIDVRGGQIVFERGTVSVAPVDPPTNRALQIARAGAMRRRIEQAIDGGTRDGTISIDRGDRSPMIIHVQRVDANAGWLTIYGA